MALSALARDFAISEGMRAWAEKATPTVNIDKEHLAFVDFWRARGRRMHDWTAVWRNWMRRCPKMGGVLYTADEIQLRKLMPLFVDAGFRHPHTHENALMYQAAFDAFDLKRRGVPQRDMSPILKLAGSKRL